MVARAQLLSDYARKMRCSPTPSEERLWQRLKGSQLGVGFRRQHVLGSYIVDLAAPKARLVVEVDGRYHAERVGADAKRGLAHARAGAWCGWGAMNGSRGSWPISNSLGERDIIARRSRYGHIARR